MKFHRVFYLPPPNEDGIFLGHLASDNFEEWSSVYRFELLKDQENRAYFSIENEQSAISRALECSSKYIFSVCESENFPNNNTKKILTEEKGIAKLLPSGNWKMEQKAKIEFAEKIAENRSSAPATAKPQQEIDYEKEALKKQVEELQKQNKKLLSQMGVASPPFLSPLPPPLSPKKKEVFYLSMPWGDSFIAQNATQNFVKQVSFYRVEKFEGETKVLVYVENRPDVVQRFLYAPERQRDVCEVGTNFRPDVTRIETETPGEAVLEGDKWRVVKKVKIRYYYEEVQKTQVEELQE